MCSCLLCKNDIILYYFLNILVRDKNFFINGLNDKRWKGIFYVA